MTKSLLFLSIFFTLFSLNAQNLIVNAGFEHNRGCPNGENGHFATLALGWRNPNKATPDYYHSCGEPMRYSTPQNVYDYLKPFAGEAYIALLSRPAYREYIQSKLREPLKKGTTYRIKIFVRSSTKFSHLCSDIGLLFSKNPISSDDVYRFKEVEPQIISEKDKIISNKKWTLIQGKFIAKGGEEYVTIGSFRKSPKFERISEDETKPINSYLYVDNISTEPHKKGFILPPKGKSKTLKNVYFEFDESKLHSASYEELNMLVKTLKKNKNVNLEIIGHADIVGDQEYNLNLSKSRAQTVANYLVKKGINTKRLSYSGVGSSKSSKSLDDEKKQSLDRKVEIKVVN